MQGLMTGAVIRWPVARCMGSMVGGRCMGSMTGASSMDGAVTDTASIN